MNYLPNVSLVFYMVTLALHSYFLLFMISTLHLILHRISEVHFWIYPKLLFDKVLHESSIENEAIKAILSLFIFFHENILSLKKAPKCKQTIFTLLEVFVHAKNCCIYCLVFPCFCFVSWFLLVTCFCALKIFS